ncbi:MAG: hypothetical protein PF569_05580 [Candidatus Woesearchaeota archaeon]|jgi:membrane protease YdiL (CAAX protease family)|nr:hypothetical protein [Candidatus Woesearchaeota archaeon]
MKIKRAIGISILTYIVSFIIGTIIAILFDIDLNIRTVIPIRIWVLAMLISIILVIIFSLWYFKKKSTTPSTKEGFKLGLTIIIVGIILDLTIINIYIFNGSSANIASYYSDPLLLVSILIIIVTATITGWLKDYGKITA